MEKMQIRRIIVAIICVILEIAALSLDFLVYSHEEKCDKDGSFHVWVLVHNILTASAIIPDVMYVFLLCCLDRLGGEPLTVMYGFYIGIILILAGLFMFITLIESCESNTTIYCCVSGCLTMLAAFFHIGISHASRRRLSEIERIWPARRIH